MNERCQDAEREHSRWPWWCLQFEAFPHNLPRPHHHPKSTFLHYAHIQIAVSRVPNCVNCALVAVMYIHDGPRKSSPPSVLHASLLLISVFTLCYGPGLLFHGGPRKSSPGPQHSVNTEINTVARTRLKRKAGYFFVAHAVQFTNVATGRITTWRASPPVRHLSLKRSVLCATFTPTHINRVLLLIAMSIISYMRRTNCGHFNCPVMYLLNGNVTQVCVGNSALQKDEWHLRDVVKG